ncbi:UNVERIFIED_CONTAM: CDP-glycerol glycerophosphotransferase family protein, partial [Pseudomonas aeruginosa]
PGIEPDFFEYLPGPLVENEKQLIVALSNFSINSYKDNITRINEEWNQYQSKETINKIVELVERILGGFCEK